MRHRIGRMGLALMAVALGNTSPLAGQLVDDPDPERFASQFEDWAEYEARNSVPTGSILFVGSSSIRFWDTAEYFPEVQLINRGFGGSHISDVVYWAEDAVTKHRPSVIVHYAGDNDISAGKNYRQVFEDFAEFVDLAMTDNPSVQVVFLSIKPSLTRWDDWPMMQAANAYVKIFTEGRANLHYVDVGSAMLNDVGEPIPELFIDDGLHMTPAGYELWTEILTPVLERLQ